jgi:pimeloyl-ACP methyl ester carboxylesterase
LEPDSWRVEKASVGGGELRYRRGGEGPAVVVLHHDIGNPDWLPFHRALAARNTVYVPDLPGWGGSERLPWLRSVRDIAVLLHHFEDRLGLTEITVVGLGFGGWVAAEMATMDSRRYSGLALVAAAGLQPEEGEILDQFLLSYDEYVRQGFHNPAAHDAVFTSEPTTERLMEWDVAREMVARVAWKPYLFSQTLGHLLGDLSLKTLVVAGGKDRIVPPSCARQYAAAIRGAVLHVFPDTGHFVDMERPAELAALIDQHLL